MWLDRETDNDPNAETRRAADVRSDAREGEGRGEDRAARRDDPGHGYTGSDFESDWAGRAILDRYMTGAGDWHIDNDAAWSEYMMANERLRQQVEAQLLQHAETLAASSAGMSKQDFSFPVIIDSGEGITGYQYLHGTNAAAGDFQIAGTAVVEPGTGAGTVVVLNAAYSWHDFIDPNPEYASDIWKSEFAEAITLGAATSFEIGITWRTPCRIEVDPSGKAVKVNGWPGK